jgi:hypothetical protein
VESGEIDCGQSRRSRNALAIQPSRATYPTSHANVSEIVRGWWELNCVLTEKELKMKLYKISDVDGLDFHTHTIKHEVGLTLHCHDWNPDPYIVCGQGLHGCETIAEIFDLMGAKPCRVFVIDVPDDKCVRSLDKWRFNDGIIIQEIHLDGLVTKEYHFVTSGLHENITDGIWVVSGDAQVSYVSGNAQVRHVSGNAQVRLVSGNAQVRLVSGNAQVGDVSGDAQVSDVYGDAQVSDVSGKSIVTVFENDSKGVGFHNVTENAIVVDYRTDPPAITAGWIRQ